MTREIEARFSADDKICYIKERGPLPVTSDVSECERTSEGRKSQTLHRIEAALQRQTTLAPRGVTVLVGPNSPAN